MGFFCVTCTPAMPGAGAPGGRLVQQAVGDGHQTTTVPRPRDSVKQGIVHGTGHFRKGCMLYFTPPGLWRGCRMCPLATPTL